MTKRRVEILEPYSRVLTLPFEDADRMIWMDFVSKDSFAALGKKPVHAEGTMRSEWIDDRVLTAETLARIQRENSEQDYAQADADAGPDF